MEMRIEGPSTPLQPSEPQKYLTQDGDTLRSIGTQFSVQPEHLLSFNNLKIGLDDNLTAGREILIPQQQPQTQGTEGSSKFGQVIEKVSAEKAYNPFVDPGVIGAN